jgi:hypothetical protein
MLPPMEGSCRRITIPVTLLVGNSRMRQMLALKGLAMETRLCWASLGIAGVLLLLFILDLITGFPFGISSISPTVEIICIICCALVGYLAWDALQDVR